MVSRPFKKPTKNIKAKSNILAEAESIVEGAFARVPALA